MKSKQNKAKTKKPQATTTTAKTVIYMHMYIYSSTYAAFMTCKKIQKLCVGNLEKLFECMFGSDILLGNLPSLHRLENTIYCPLFIDSC